MIESKRRCEEQIRPPLSGSLLGEERGHGVAGYVDDSVLATRCELGQLALQKQGKSD